MTSTVKPAATTATATSTGKPANARFIVNPLWSTIGTIFHVAFSFLCIYLTPFGRTGTLSSASFTSQLYDLLFTESLGDFDRSFADSHASYVGPALLACFTRPFSLVFDEKIRNLLFAKVVPHLNLPASLVDTAKLYILETRMWNFIVARALLAVLVALSAASLRQALSLKFKSAALPRLYTALCLASAIPLLAATSLSSQAFSIALLNLALAAVFNGKLAQSFSLLTVNAVIFDSLGGSILLLSALASLSLIESFSQSTALLSILATFPLAAVVSFVIDSLFYNKFIWPQGEILYRHIITLMTFVKGLDYIKLFTSLKPAELLNSKHFANILIILIPALIVYAIGRANRYTRAMLRLYTLSAIGNLAVAYVSGSNALMTCTPLLGPLLVATSISVLGFIRTHKSLTFLFFFGILIPALGWSLGRIHLEISGTQQYTGEALMALNRKILKDAQEGVPVRVAIDFDVTGNGYSRFIELTRNRAIYSTGEAKGRIDYFIGSSSVCAQDKPMKSFKGFSKIDIKSLKVIEADQLAVYRASATCPPPARPHLKKFDTSNASPALLPSLISARFFKGRFAGLKEQREFIAKYLGKFNHKKVSNSMALVAYLYQGLLDQI